MDDATLAAPAASLAWLEVQAMAMTELPPGAALLASGGAIAQTQCGRVLRGEVVVLLPALVAAASLANGAPPAP